MAIKRDIRYGGTMTDKQERDALIKSIDKSLKSGGWQTTPNNEGGLMEQEAAKFLGVKYGALASSGSCAGLLALEALELPKGSEVIIGAVTFPTIFNIILQCGLVPVVVDCGVGTYVPDVAEIEKAITKKTKAVIAIHPLGNPVDMISLMKLAKRKKLKVIEDCCDTWGGTLNGKQLGSFGDVSFTSFHAAHIVSMGIGGGVFTNDPKIAKNVKMFRDWGRQADTNKPNTYKHLPKDYNPRFIYEKIGYNFQVLELQAAMGRVQLKKAKKIKEMRKKNFDYLVKELEQFNVTKREDGLIFPFVEEGADVCWFALPLTYTGNRGLLVKHLEERGIETRSMFAGNITRHPAYKHSKFRIHGKLEEADYILRHSFWIGVHPRMTQEDREFVVDSFKSFFDAKSR